MDTGRLLKAYSRVKKSHCGLKRSENQTTCVITVQQFGIYVIMLPARAPGKLPLRSSEVVITTCEAVQMYSILRLQDKEEMMRIGRVISVFNVPSADDVICLFPRQASYHSSYVCATIKSCWRPFEYT